ncbi:MAG: hypothetical protein ACYS6K_28470 [Planctomycetota bacterium]|jgi:hypothetical protein
MSLWEKAMQIQDGEHLLITTEQILPVKALTSIVQLINEVELNGNLSKNSGISANCIAEVDEGCNLIFQEIRRRLETIEDVGCEDFRKLAKLTEE